MMRITRIRRLWSAYPKTRFVPHVQLVFSGGVHEFGWALLLKGSLGSDTPVFQGTVSIAEHERTKAETMRSSKNLQPERSKNSSFPASQSDNQKGIMHSDVGACSKPQ
jgi:hypothetical protein